MQEGSWNFCGNAIPLAPYDGLTKPFTIKLETLEIWIQIHDFPDGYAHLLKPLSRKVGEVLYAESRSHDFTSNIYCVWVRINVLNPLDGSENHQWP